MTVSGKLYTPANYPRAWRSLIAAKYSKAKIETIPFVPGQTDASADYLAKFPAGEIPVFEGPNNLNIFEANAIAHYVGNDQLRGGKNEAMVTQWVNYAENTIMPCVSRWVYPCLGVAQPDKKFTDMAKTSLSTSLKHLNNFLASRTYLVDEHITQADITMYTSLYLLFTHVYDEKARAPFPHVIRWYLTIGNQNEVVNVVGKPNLCSKPAQFDAKKFAELHPSQGASGKQEKAGGKQKGKQQEPAKPKPKPDPTEEEDKPAPKAENPLAKLPVGTFIMDEFKRTYCNNDIKTVGLPYLWEHWDNENYSMWHCSYKYPEELRLLFMSSNLVGGVFQRLEKMLKMAFGSMCVLGKDKDNTIKGLFIWRGTGLIMDVDPDLQTDYESFTWTKLDPKNPATKKIVEDYFLPADEIDGKPVANYKLFK